MQGVFHQRNNPKFNYVVVPLDTQVLDSDNDKCSSTVVPLEIDFKLSVKKRFYDINMCPSKVQARREKCTIGDIRWLVTQSVEVTLQLSQVLCLMGIEEDRWDEVVDQIVDTGRRIGDSDSNKGPKVLRMRVDMKCVFQWGRCEECTKELERDVLIKNTLKRVRVVGDEDEVEKECGDSDDEEEEERRKRKRRQVVYENEVCPICIEKFALGSDDGSCMPCSHVFHGKCIVRWLKRSHPKCPICRFEMPVELVSQACGIHGHPVFSRQCHSEGNMIRG